MTGAHGLEAVRRWWFPPVAVARLAWLRTFLYLFVILDIHLFVDDVLPKGHTPELYHPLLVGRVVHLPPPSVPLTWALWAVIVVGSLVLAAGRLPLTVGYLVAAAFTWWMVIGMSFGKVDHDHLALVLAVWVMPSAHRARWTDEGASEQVGWTVRWIQIATVATYSLSWLTKTANSSWTAAWPQGHVLAWAVIRRANTVNAQLLEHPWMLRPMQWVVYCAEFLSPMVLFLRRRALLAAALFWMGFHVMTFVLLGIHFLPTVVCWLSFAPLERLTPLLRRLSGQSVRDQPRSLLDSPMHEVVDQ
ncbi:MAG TPA: hypothetical protein VIM10_18785 [Actinopolymorphaceae bacterium]